MKGKNNNTNRIRINRFVYLLVFLLFLLFIARLSYISLKNYKVGSKTINDFIAARNIKEEVIMPDRGNIYDRNGNILAEDVSSYTVIAYLNKDRGKDKEGKYRYVKDKEDAASKLSPLIYMEKEKILELLNKDLYQVELGPGGRNLSQLEMEEIKNLNIDGIDFIKNSKRYYPNGDFASYLLGYTVNKEDENGNIWKYGELGTEGYYNEELTGKSGYITYEQDLYGYKIANSREYKVDAENGSDIYLTIDNTIELFLEEELKEASKGTGASKGILVVANAKTGEILGYSSTPSFDPNERNIKNYLDPLVSYTFEPGSTMKIFSYMCAIENGKYDGDKTYKSGSKTYTSVLDENDTITINDWNKKGWGYITYDRGFALSSNIAVASMLENFITKKDLQECYKKYGFGSKTGVTLKQEAMGDIKFTYDVEAATAGYGQGITITPIQMIRALTIVANDGVMLSPYVVSKIEKNSDIVEENTKKELGTYASKETIDKIKSLMKSVINPDASVATGYAYYMDGYDLIGKTGTASIFDNKKGRYLDPEGEYVYSFAGMYPMKEPEIIVYMILERPYNNGYYMPKAIKNVVTNVSKYLNITETKELEEAYILKDYSNRKVLEVKKELENNSIQTIVLGSGNKIIDQYPKINTKLYKGDKVILLTNNYNNNMINFIGMSKKEAIEVIKLMNKDYYLEGNGYVYEQNYQEGNIITDKIILKLKEIC